MALLQAERDYEGLRRRPVAPTRQGRQGRRSEHEAAERKHEADEARAGTRMASCGAAMCPRGQVGRRHRFAACLRCWADCGVCDSMASMARRHAPWCLRVACASLVLVTNPIAATEANAVGAQLIGVWRGTSTCIDRVAAPACQNETVVYEFTPGPQPGAVHWVADKVIAGQRERMGELELEYDKAEGCWEAVFTAPRVTSVWRLTVDGSRLTGTARLLPGNETIRRVDLRKE